MSGIIELKTYPAPPVCREEILRYAGCRRADEATLSLLEDCLPEALDQLNYRVCYRRLPLQIEGSCCRFDGVVLRSKRLAKHLSGCREAVVFAATLGVGMDRLIGKYIRISPAKALLLDAVGTERIEALCDAFCKELGPHRARFSPGYGDLPLSAQRDFFALLDCERKLGLCLNESLLISPSKSVTAVVGLGAGACVKSCAFCDKNDCSFRREA